MGKGASKNAGSAMSTPAMLATSNAKASVRAHVWSRGFPKAPKGPLWEPRPWHCWGVGPARAVTYLIGAKSSSRPPTLHFIGSTTDTLTMADTRWHAQLKAEIRKAEHHFKKEAAQKSSDKNVNVNASEGTSSSKGEATDSSADSSDYEGWGFPVDSDGDEMWSTDVLAATRFLRLCGDEGASSSKSEDDVLAATRFIRSFGDEGASSSKGEAKDSKSESSDYEGMLPLALSSSDECPYYCGKPRLLPFQTRAVPRERHHETTLKQTTGATPRATPRFLQARLNPPAAKPTRADGKQSHHEKAFAVYTAKCSQRAKDQYLLEAVLRVENYMARNRSPDKRPVKRWGNLAEFKLTRHKKYYDEQALKHAKKMHTVQAFKNRSLKHVKAMHQECDSSTKVFII